MQGVKKLNPAELRQLCLAACPELGAVYALAERVARLNPDAGTIGPGMLADLVGTARAVCNGHTPRDTLRDSHAALQDALAFVALECGDDLKARAPARWRSIRDTLDTAAAINPTGTPAIVRRAVVDATAQLGA